jgi:hypothetical protein
MCQTHDTVNPLRSPCVSRCEKGRFRIAFGRVGRDHRMHEANPSRITLTAHGDSISTGRYDAPVNQTREGTGREDGNVTRNSGRTRQRCVMSSTARWSLKNWRSYRRHSIALPRRLPRENAMKTPFYILTFCVVAVASEFGEGDDKSATTQKVRM